MLDDEIVGNLVRLGLTINEAKAFKGLVVLGTGTAREVAEVSGIPRSKVYDALNHLDERGLIRKILGSTPMQYRPISPKTAVNYLLERIQHSSKSTLKAFETLEEARAKEQEEYVWALSGDEQVKLGMISIIEKAQESIFIATRNPSLLSSLRTAFADAKRRNVSIELFTTSAEESLFQDFTHYLELKSVLPGPDMLTENLVQVLGSQQLKDSGWNPDLISILVADLKLSIAIFLPTMEGQRMWALVVDNPIIVLFQWQVIKTTLSAIERIVSSGSFRQS